jgi:hypothetical protein
MITAEHLAELKLKGFVILREPEITKLIGLPEDYHFLNKEERLRDNGEKDLPEQLGLRFKITGEYLKNKYLIPQWPQTTYRKFIVWDGVDRDNQYWHTDAFEGMDVFFLYYFDDTFAESGGAIHFKWSGGVHVHQPKAGDLILVSNRRGFFHRADDSQIRRRVASFDFAIDGGI